VRSLAALLTAITLLAAAAPSALAAACPRASLPDVEDEVMCLQCGVPLNVAEDAPSARRERAFIAAQIDRCETKAQIKQQLVAQFGDRILAEPHDRSAWLVPALLVAGGGLGVAFAAWTWRRRRAAGAGASTPGAPLPARDTARLDADLDRYDL
jgi:cytochrome c-type biogenesis protein CcmH